MVKEDYEKIINEVKNLGDIPNSELVKLMDQLSSEFESVKDSIIKTTYYLDQVEELYNLIFKEYQKRSK